MFEKKAIELATIHSFLGLYNHIMITTYKVALHSDNPDFICSDSEGSILQVDVTLTESAKGDIKARLGRSNHKNVKKMKVSSKSLQDNTIEIVLTCIRKKLLKRYGPNTALVVRDTCPLDLNWDLFLYQISKVLGNEYNPYDKGVWIINDSKDKTYRVL